MAITSLSQQTQTGALAPTTAQKPDKLGSAATEEAGKLSALRSEGTDAKDAKTTGAVDAAKLREMVDESNQTLEAKHMRLQFSVHEETGSQVVQVFDRDTDKLVRQYPPEEYLTVAEQIQNMGPEASLGLMFKVEA
jgi:flagellar protein FlaG